MAAGLGFKNFVTGDVLTAGDVNGYLMQGVLVFASAAARDSAITSPQEGQFAYTKDTNGLWYYDGAAWVASGATGDIEGVTAGIGISGGGTSGTVTITNSMATAIDAKGDLVGGTGADTFARLAVGANDTVLTADSSTATGLKWASPASGGAVLLETVNLTSGNSQSTATLSTAYDNLVIYIENPRAGASANVALRFNSDSSNIYTSANFGSRSNASPSLDGNNSVDRGYFIPQMEDAASGNFAVLTIPNYNASTLKGFFGNTSFKDSWYGTRFFTAIWASTAAITTIQFVTSGTWSAGTAKIYGVNR
jgi:hypothetical protein